MTSVSLLGQRADLGGDFSTIANSARVYQHLLGGSAAYAADRTAADAVYETAEWLRTAALINRDFGVLSVKWSLAHGVRQFLDLGCGYPGAVNVHEVTDTDRTGCPVVYVDNDPEVYAHARCELDEGPATTVVHADFLAMDQLLACEAVRTAFVPGAPVAVLLHDVLPWCADGPALDQAMAMLRAWMPVGSTLSITHLTDHWHHATMPDVTAAFAGHGLHVHPRSSDEISDLFGDLVQQDPGLTATGRWHEHGRYVHHPPEHSAAFAGIAVIQTIVPHHGVRDRTVLGQPQPLHCERHTTPQNDMDRRTEPVHVAPKGPFMAASWTSKTPARLMDIVDDTGELLPDGRVVAPHRPAPASLTGAAA
ncbi:SAM-dependent methyltransferase [Streptomyces albipurpureus]|uniref:SAM-dependent methyltransferase n=1 Tax=Streptomyces albipurpureus TaxID=2897419 RepID=A0ABT0V234_9ACTN|nr:SAM-dependent methyltransferase [Streptomyces sp. CWNU-1]MCM2393623.1 SAM-dependent methyltransferase [Streptomyces sp. CWNU-1]